MSRKTSQMAKMPAHGAAKLSPFDVGHKPSRVGKTEGHSQQRRSTPKNLVQVQVADLGGSGASVESASSDDEADGEGSGSDGAEADDDDDDDEPDPNVEAPSGRAMIPDGRQAGHFGGLSQSLEHDVGRNTADRAEQNVGEDSSNDEAYGGVDLISDSERDGSDMDCVEERAIIDSEDEDAGKAPSIIPKGKNVGRGRSPSESSEDSWEGFDFGDSQLTDHQDFFDEQFDRTDLDGFLDDDNDILGNVDMFPDTSLLFPSSPPRRRVRFAEPLLDDDLVSPHVSGKMPGFESDVPSTPTSGLGQGETKAPPDQRIDGNDSEDGSGSSSGYESEFQRLRAKHNTD